jgi:hypothetical protein
MIRTLIEKYFLKDSVSESEFLKLRLENEHLKIQYLELQKQLLFQQTSHRDIPLAGFDDLGFEPEQPAQRKQYIADVTIFFENILHRKLKVSIAEIRELLSNIGRQEGTPLDMPRTEYDMFLRGMEAAFWKIQDWATSLDAESKQDLQDLENDPYGSIRQ